jgi:hypothetical protein
LPPAEKFILQLEQYAQTNPPDPTLAATNGAILKTYSLAGGPPAVWTAAGAGLTETVGVLYIKGFSTQSGWNLYDANKPPGSSEILLSAIDYSSIASAIPANATSKQPQTNQFVIDRPSQNGIYELYLTGINGHLLAQQTGGGGNGILGEYVCSISLTPMTSEQLKNWDCRP